MNKKVIKAMFVNICSKEETRPIMMGVHFERERTYASDGHLLVIFKEGSVELDGKTMSSEGKEIEGKYPNVDSVFPSKEMRGDEFTLDVVQLQKACAYHIRQLSATQNDKVVIYGTGYNIRSLFRLLNTITTIGDPKNVKFYSKDKDHATVVVSDQMQSLIMPTLYEESDVDDMPLDFADTKTISYENFINDYVFNGWKKKEPKDELAWAV
ncbi:MAG: hypothetical protein IJ550_02145 [Bacteroidaceae bacterium]|nr:hypothetical protein [Bacteroidaceae bacterium]